MRLLSWNCQGLRNPWIVRSLRNIVRDQAPTVCFLMETRLDKEGFDKHCKELPFRNKLIVKKPNSRGGFALLWKQEVQIDVINYIENHILAKMVEDDCFQWLLTGFHEWPEADQKTKSWALLSHLATFVNGPWCCIGDFNAIYMQQRNKVPSHHRTSRQRNLVQHWSHVVQQIWDSVVILLHGITKDLVEQTLGNDWIERWLILVGSANFQLVK